jgi:L-threonylcarbamoyladenylate synthase
LRTVLPDVQPPRQQIANHVNQTVHSEASGHTSPGQLFTHYAPAIPLLLYNGSVEAMCAAMLVELKRRQEQGEYVGVLVADEDVATFQESGALINTLGNADDPVQIATALFAGLRALEDAHVHVILCRNFGDHGLGLAIRDRLQKAAGGKIIDV